MKEGAEVVVEKVGRKALEAGAEKAGKEALEAGAKRTTAEMLEQLAKHEGDDIAKVVDGSIDEQVAKKPSFKIGESDGGPGTWENRHSPKKRAEYQKKTIGAPDDTEYVVKTDKMKSGEKNMMVMTHKQTLYKIQKIGINSHRAVALSLINLCGIKKLEIFKKTLK